MDMLCDNHCFKICFKLSISSVGTCAPEDTPGKLSRDNIEIEFMMRTK